MASRDEHKSYMREHEAHTRTSGCLIICITQYQEGHPHSHRWQAAEKARAETRIPYGDCESPMVITIGRSLEGLLTDQALDGDVWKEKGKTKGKLKPFFRHFAPFPHNAHHIIPISTMKECLEDIYAMAGENSDDMRNIVVIGLLRDEKYNINERVNMVILPLRRIHSKKLGLPRHFHGKQKDHPDYRELANTWLLTAIPNKYRSLASDVEERGHNSKKPPPQIKALVEKISHSIYEAIVSLSAVHRGKNWSLDDTAAEIFQKARKIYIR